jgi:hypothetical protein
LSVIAPVPQNVAGFKVETDQEATFVAPVGRESGPSMNSITYMEAGLIVNLSASAPPEDPPGKGLCVQANFELSALADSAVEIAPQVRATSIRKMNLRHSETPRFGKPLVLLNVSAPGGGDKAQPVAYVIRAWGRQSEPATAGNASWPVARTHAD